MKESEARTKRCCGPMGCGNPPNELPELVVGQNFENSEYYVQIMTRMCIGSDCMAWVTDDDQSRSDESFGHCGLVRQ